MLREKREATGVSQEALSLRLNKPRTFVGKIESGTRRLDVIELVQICQSLGVDVPAFTTELIKRIKP
jgi:transcriptional regulator with XRE-family HTH domain